MSNYYSHLKADSFEPSHVTVLVGVSGCGKSRTCFDISRRKPCIYFEVGQQYDLNHLFPLLETSKKIESELTDYTDFCCCALIVARIITLEHLQFTVDDVWKPFLLPIQKSFAFQRLVHKLFMKIVNECEPSSVIARAKSKSYLTRHMF